MAAAGALTVGVTGGVLLMGQASVWLLHRWAGTADLNDLVMLVVVAIFLPLAMLLLGSAHHGTWRSRLTTAAFVLFTAGWVLHQWAVLHTAQVQALHERGRAAQGVVRSVVKGRDGDVLGLEVCLADGSTLGRVQVGFGSRVPDTGEEVVVTFDPDGPVLPLLGPVPGPPDNTVRNAALAAVALASPVIGTRLARALRARRTKRDDPGAQVRR